MVSTSARNARDPLFDSRSRHTTDFCSLGLSKRLLVQAAKLAIINDI